MLGVSFMFLVKQHPVQRECARGVDVIGDGFRAGGVDRSDDFGLPVHPGIPGDRLGPAS